MRAPPFGGRKGEGDGLAGWFGPKKKERGGKKGWAREKEKKGEKREVAGGPGRRKEIKKRRKNLFFYLEIEIKS